MPAKSRRTKKRKTSKLGFSPPERERRTQSISNILVTAEPGLAHWSSMVDNKRKVLRRLRGRIQSLKMKGREDKARKLNATLKREKRLLKAYKEAYQRSMQHYDRHLGLARKMGILKEVLRERDRKLQEIKQRKN